MKLAALCLLIAGCLSPKQKATIEEHSIEMGCGIGAGAALVALGPAGPFVAIGLAVAGVAGAEAAKPPPPKAEIIIVHERVDQDGKVTTSIEHPKSKEGNMPTDPWYQFLIDAWKWIVGIAVAVYLFTHPAAVTTIVGIAKSGWQLGLNAAKTIQKALHPIATRKTPPP